MSDRSIIEAINKMTGQHKVDTVTYINATVQSVNIEKRMCDCIAVDGHTEYILPNVRLMPSVDDGLFIEPKIDSNVKIIFSQNVEPFVCQYSAIENITIDANTLIKLNDGSFEGLIKIVELTEKLNKLKDEVNSLVTKFNNHIHITTATIGATPTPGTIAPTTTKATNVSEFKKPDYENTKIKHGE